MHIITQMIFRVYPRTRTIISKIRMEYQILQKPVDSFNIIITSIYYIHYIYK